MFYQFAKFVCYLFLRFFCRWEVQGRENFPLEGPVIVIANHISYLDPVAVGVAAPRTVRFMAKEELFHIPIVNWIITGLHAFPVRRGRSDRAALKAALEVLHDGQVLGMFPEGTRSKDGRLLPFQHGAALLALKTGAPLLPVAVKNTNRVFRGGRIKVIIGQPLKFETAGPSTPQQVQDLTVAAYQAVAKMLA
ncbi:1-acyl-sn-glycerol-3-phosphate acyltransferase [Moorella glycerini]|uniref:1-acyl-sn-glycerol-3-phosphate acyltransferase n=1 Tax=Neomoorella stamsii TaxID=1266720 RepID=A0A9X7J3M9_9FIRM|nr:MULTISPECIES: lysophospholipid acyltransferase family protein [Moorella]PRR73031.1 1-acyl-sn-glycerol-3-phosphate acyltransferase [Moorella stamsii]CEP67702.1 1-acyl-sn-glycerol-3-phosphate acyltransferase [Moorella glycerini]CEP69639.1 1-acyl-sn-glycerol-3-phosphate acyltransferase [Moorella glycerini]